MQVYVIKNINNDIYGIYRNEKTALFVKDNLNSKFMDESLFYSVETFTMRDDY